MSKYFIKVDNPFSILLDKQHKVLRNKHPEIRLILRGHELEVVTNSQIKEEALLARRGDKDYIVPVVGSWTHKMHWVLVNLPQLLDHLKRRYRNKSRMRT